MSSQGASNPVLMDYGDVCEMKLSYRISNDQLGNVLRARSCVLPSEAEKIMFDTTSIYGNLINNCSEFFVPIGLPSCAVPTSL